ncbi:MAG: site-specific integrase [Phycisphaeraceae bacterium]
MPRKPSPAKLPAYRKHGPSGRAVVTLADAASGRRRDMYLGVYGSPESRTEYERIIGQWLAGGKVVEQSAKQSRAVADADAPDPRTLTVTQLARAYWRMMKARYGVTGDDARLPSHLFNVRSILRLMRSAAGGLPAREFGPRHLRQVMALMVARGWNRVYANKSTGLIRTVYKWAVAEQLVPIEVWQALTAVSGLRRGEQGVNEGGTVKPVPLAHVDAIRPHVAPQVESLIDMMLLTGARAGEVVGLKLADLNTTGKIWTAAVADHKGAWRGKARTLYIGPKAQKVIQQYMPGRPVDVPLFSPKEANADMKARDAHCHRRENQKPSPKRTDRTIGDCYTTASMRRAIERACDKAGTARWTPHQLRHAAATLIRKDFGLEAAAIILGHSSAAITDQVYAERDVSRAEDVLLKIG